MVGLLKKKVAVLSLSLFSFFATAPIQAFAHHPIVKKTQRFAKAQLGKPYIWGGGHNARLLSSRGYDCSGLASAVARIGGYKGPVITTYSAPAYSRPARRSDWLQWGIKPGHMVVKVNGIIYEAARSGIPIRRGEDRGYHWRTPHGIKKPRIHRKRIINSRKHVPLGSSLYLSKVWSKSRNEPVSQLLLSARKAFLSFNSSYISSSSVFG